MRALDRLRLASTALRSHRLRSVLTLSGIAIGVAAVLIMTSLGESARQYVLGQFASLGADLLVVLPGKTETTGAIPGSIGTTHDVTLDDARAVARRLPGVRAAVPVAMGNDLVRYGGRSRQSMVLGTTAAMQEVFEIDLRSGSFLPDEGIEHGAPVCVLGADLAESLFGSASAVGAPIRIGDQRLKVIGVSEQRGTTLGFDLDEIVLVPAATAMRMFDRTSLFRLMIKLWHAEDVPAAQEELRAIFLDRHGEESVTILTPDTVAAALTAILAVLTTALAGIAAISLIVAGVGVMNVMLVAVAERRAEVGLMAALGARARDVLSLFLIEAVVLTGCGGVLGVLAGAAVVWTLQQWVGEAWPVVLPWWSAAAGMATAMVTGAVFGVLPAWRASRLDPVEALARRR